MNKYTKNGVVYTAPIKINREIEVWKTAESGQKIKEKVKVVTFTKDEKLILEHGFQVYTPKIQPVVIDVKQQRFSKYKVKQQLEQLGLWEALKEMITEQMYEDLLIADDFAFDDVSFTAVYETLKVEIPNIDQLLLQCIK